YRLIRDNLTEDVERFYIDDIDEYHNARALLDVFAPELKDRVEYFHSNGRSLFEQHGINEEIEKGLKRRVWLKSGGYLVIDQTEALTVIDVNTGKFIGTSNLQDTVLRT